MYIELLKEMLNEMATKKNVSLISNYYHKNFLLYTNGQIINYTDFLSSHEEYYNTLISYKVRYDEETLLEQGNKVAGRVWVTTQRPQESAKQIEVIFIAEYQDNKIYRLWKLTYPDWSKLPAFTK